MTPEQERFLNVAAHIGRALGELGGVDNLAMTADPETGRWHITFDITDPKDGEA